MGKMIIRFCVFWLIAGFLNSASAAIVTRDGIPEAPPAAAGRLADYLQARSACALGFSPQGQVLIRTRFGDTDQLHVVAQSGGARLQLTFGADPVGWAAFSPDPLHSAFAFLRDQGGDGNFQLYYQRSGDAAARILTDGHAETFSPVWSSSGREIAFSSNARDAAAHDIVVVDPESGALPHLVVSGDGAGWRALDWAADDHLLLVLKTVSSSESHLYLVDLQSGQRRELDAATNPVSITDARLARDGQGVYYISDGYGEFSQLRYINIFTGQKAALSDHIPAGIGELALSRDGRYLAFISNEADTDRLNIVDLIAHQDLTPPRLPFAGVMRGLGFDAEGKNLVFSLAAPTRPEDAFVLNIAANSLTAWTRSEAGPLDSSKFVLPRSVKIPTFDREGMRAREVPAYVYETAGSARHPVLIALNGGPEEQVRPGFEPWIQYLAIELGYAIVTPALRGSRGYGKAYAAAGQGSLREDAIKDIGALLAWLRAQHDLDARRVVISGRGYGASLALAALVNYSDRLRGGIAVSGIGDFVEWLSTAPAGSQQQRRAQFGDEREPDMRAMLRRLSPLASVDRIQRPLLIVHGRNDREVPILQSEALVAVARSRNVPVWYLIANDQGHEFGDKRALDATFSTVAQFLETLP
jgi:dipeptidyl aminopeptidase/acylaminoacyl peptidase